MDMAKFGVLLGLTGDGLGHLESNIHWRWFLIVTKLLTSILDITSESFTLYYATIDRAKFNQNATLTVPYQNKTHVFNVNLNKFNGSYISYTVFFSLYIVAVLIHLKAQISRLSSSLGPVTDSHTKFVSPVIAFVLEMPILVSEASMLKAQCFINWDEQFWSLITHVSFVFNMFLTITLDWIFSIKKFSCKVCCCGSVFICFIFLLTCMAYAPVSFAMVGFELFNQITLEEDFGGIIVGERTKTVLGILIEFGRIGNLIWSVILVSLLMAVAIICCCKQNSTESSEN